MAMMASAASRTAAAATQVVAGHAPALEGGGIGAADKGCAGASAAADGGGGMSLTGAQIVGLARSSAGLCRGGRIAR